MHILCSLLFSEIRGGTRGTTNDVTIWRTRVECWISKTTCTHAHAYVHAPGHTNAWASAPTHKYGICIFFPRQKRFRERSSMLRYVDIACPVFASYILSSCCLPALGRNIFLLNVPRLLFLFSSEF